MKSGDQDGAEFSNVGIINLPFSIFYYNQAIIYNLTYYDLKNLFKNSKNINHYFIHFSSWYLHTSSPTYWVDSQHCFPTPFYAIISNPFFLNYCLKFHHITHCHAVIYTVVVFLTPLDTFFSLLHIHSLTLSLSLFCSLLSTVVCTLSLFLHIMCVLLLTCF